MCRRIYGGRCGDGSWSERGTADLSDTADKKGEDIAADILSFFICIESCTAAAMPHFCLTSVYKIHGTSVYKKEESRCLRDSKGEKVYEKVFFFKNNYSIGKSCVKSVMKF